MNRLFRFCVLAAVLAVPCVGCGDSTKPAEPKVSGGNAPPVELKRAGNAQGGVPGKAGGAGAGTPQTKTSEN